MLSAFEFKSSYNRIDDNIAEDFYMPCMQNACRYDRISGFFGSTVYVIAWKALKDFVANGGKMRIICSPVLTQEDRAALEEGDCAKKDEVLKAAMSAELDALLQDDELRLSSRLLACLVANGIIELKIGLVKDNGHPTIKSLFHDKFGVFYDAQGNAVGFRGSFNETYKGLSNDGNIESADVFQSWDGGKETKRIVDAIDLFERLWTGKLCSSVEILEIPTAIKKLIFEQAKATDLDSLIEEVRIKASKEEKWKPSSKGRTPRKHQAQALDNWVLNGRRGILKHATGSGKTFTAICAIGDALKRGETVLVLAPSKELLHHWKKEISESIPERELFFLLCGDGHNSWKRPGELERWTAAGQDVNKIIVATMPTAANPEFVNRVSSGTHLFIVADEVHRLGSPQRQRIFEIDAGARLGLSATPERYGDPEGTTAIFSYFGGIVKPEFSLEDAIKKGVLTKYFYHPQKVYLNAEEQEDWDLISKEISKIIARYTENGASIREILRDNPRISQLLINRARILKNAKNKIELAVNILKTHYQSGQKWIVYCDNQTQLNTILSRLEDDFDVYDYHSEMEGDTVETLRYFSSHGGVLVSIKCLDEGVDIPATTHALILASSKNPREFIQRRGRVLRLSPGKTFAHLFDAITLPAGSVDEFEKSNSIVLNELSRAIQFGTWAENPSCITDLKLISIDYGIDYRDYVTGGTEDVEDK